MINAIGAHNWRPTWGFNFTGNQRKPKLILNTSIVPLDLEPNLDYRITPKNKLPVLLECFK